MTDGALSLQLALANGATGLANLLVELGSPSQPLPSYLTADDDLDYEEVRIIWAPELTALYSY